MIPTIENSPKLQYYASQIRVQNFPGYAFFVGHSHFANFLRGYVSTWLTRRSYRESPVATPTPEVTDGLEPAIPGKVSGADWKLTTAILERWESGCRELVRSR